MRTAQEQVLGRVRLLAAESVPVAEAAARVTAEAARAAVDLPPFASSAMDGFAVRAADVTSLPITLTVVGRSVAGRRHSGPLGSGEAIRIFTGAPVPDAAVDARIAKALDLLRARIRGPVRLADAAGAAALSPGRFRHLFVQETGTAFRAYVLWLRLNVAIECSMAGGSWTEAAHEAGFADSAHLTRTFKRMFGMNPATLVRQ